ncbi:MAG: head-tail connector protein [Clostridium sp.]|nr:head-tail connector protein [Clostridium sp.]
MKLEEIKQYLKIDYEDDDLLIDSLYKASIAYLEPIINIKYNTTLYENFYELLKSNSDSRLKLIEIYILAMVKEMYDGRGLTTTSTVKASEKLKYTMSHIINSLQYSDWGEYNE